MKLAKIILAACVWAYFATGLAATVSFSAAKPVWPEGREKEWNCQAGFTAEFTGAAAKGAVLRYTGATMCRVFLNGKFFGYGPARAAHGFARVEELPLGGRIKEGLNVLAIEVAGYNCDSFYTIRQPSFLSAEIVAGDGRVLAATGVDGGFSARIVKERVRKVQRFSCQRPFSEAYELEQEWDDWRTDEDCPCEHVRLAERPQLPLLPRIAPVPEYGILPAKALVATGKTAYDASLPVKTPLSMSCTESKDHGHEGFKVSELEWIPYYEMQRTKTVSRHAGGPQSSAAAEDAQERVPPAEIPDGGFALYDFGILAAGFPGLEIVCEKPCTVYFTFDEILSEDGDIDFRSERLESCCNIVAWRLKDPGRYSVESFEPCAFRYAKVVVRGGQATVSNVHIREYENPEAGRAVFRSSDPALDKVFEAARKTFAENAVDGFTDCPGRERAGWNCDGFFTGRAAIEFTGNANVERLFLQNFLLPEKFPDIPDGMLPQCYPADFPDHSIIPNWAMWFVLELDEYYARTGDREMVDGLKPRVLKLMDFFWKYRNEDGLLEKLPNTVFIEWSRSNLLVKDVNYPTNMTWARLLDVVARLYGMPAYAEEAEKVRETIRRQSWNGKFFVDRAIRQKDGTLKADSEATETCQYYAFFFGTATPESHPELWKRLVEDFGPNRKTDNKWPAVAFSNAFIGNYLRFECLSKAGLSAQILEEAKGYFSFMAERTGTLWEHDAPTASCSHGFASHIAHVLYRDVLGVREIDRVNRKVTLRFADVPLDWCEGEIPVEGGWIKVSWRRENGKIVPSFSAPQGWRIAECNCAAVK